MKRLICVLVLILGVISCDYEEEGIKNEYEFITEYSATVTVGGVIGVTERAFEIGKIYKGTDQGNGIITIRIAEHSELNDDCPNSWCYQELLEVPEDFLRLIE